MESASACRKRPINFLTEENYEVGNILNFFEKNTD